jgi:hypothetical protein
LPTCHPKEKHRTTVLDGGDLFVAVENFETEMTVLSQKEMERIWKMEMERKKCFLYKSAKKEWMECPGMLTRDEIHQFY